MCDQLEGKAKRGKQGHHSSSKPITHETSREDCESHSWEVLDSVGIATAKTKLSDNDVGAILTCIDAKNILKKLRLPDYHNLVGHVLP